MTDDLETRLAAALRVCQINRTAQWNAVAIIAALPAHGLVLRLASEPDARPRGAGVVHRERPR